MHELSIAEAIVDIAQRHAQGRRVYRVAVKVGHLRQVVPDALEFAFELLVNGTELEGAQLDMEEVPAQVRCRGCGARTHAPDFPLSCAACGGLDVEVCAGEELLVDELDVEVISDRPRARLAAADHRVAASSDPRCGRATPSVLRPGHTRSGARQPHTRGSEMTSEEELSIEGMAHGG